MSYQIRKAIRQNVSVIVGLAGGTGSGKTKSGMELATGLAGGKPFVVIDTENGRARHYAPRQGEQADGINTYEFDVIDLVAPFSPERYMEAIKAADAAGAPVIMVDSMSHEHAGDGGLLDMHDAALEEMVKRAAERGDRRSEWQIRDAGKMTAWIRPKSEHKRMMQALLQVRAHIILCFRAEEKIEMVKVEGKLEVRPKKSRTGKDGWIPIAEKTIPFECTCSFLLIDERPGVPLPIKLQEQHKPFFPADKPISKESGKLLGQWAAGGSVAFSSLDRPPTAEAPSLAPQAPSAPAPNGNGQYITPDQHTDIVDRLRRIPNGEARLKAAAHVETLWKIPRENYQRTLDWISKAMGA